MAVGIVYILINDAMPELVKIGKTTTSLAQRMKELDNTSIPLPFSCSYASQVNDCDAVERRLHEAFADRRIRSRREFFRVSPTQVRAALLLAGGKEIIISDDDIDEPENERLEDQKAVNEARQRRSRFSFSMIGIKPGTILQSWFDENVVCTVVDESRILFEGKTVSLSYAAQVVSERYGRKKGAALAGPDYWMYNDKTLTDLRYEAEELIEDT